MKIIEDVVVVGNEDVIRDLRYPKIVGSNGTPILRGLIGPGGAKSGLTMGERFCAFEEMGISADHFDKGLFTSAAAFNGIAYAAKQSHMLLGYYQKMSWFNPQVLWSAITRRDYLGLMWLMDELQKKLDVATLRTCLMDITIAVADLNAGVHLHKAKQVEDIFDLMAASSALHPIVPGKIIKGIYSVDGGYTIKSTVIEWLKVLKREIPRRQHIDLLYVANRPHPKLHFSTIEERIFHAFVNYTLANHPELAHGARSIDGKLRRVSELFERQRPRIRTCAIFPMPDENIFPNEWRKNILRVRGELTRVRTQKFLCALQPVREI